jgi:hypothetical protein
VCKKRGSYATSIGYRSAKCTSRIGNTTNIPENSTDWIQIQSARQHQYSPLPKLTAAPARIKLIFQVNTNCSWTFRFGSSRFDFGIGINPSSLFLNLFGWIFRRISFEARNSIPSSSVLSGRSSISSCPFGCELSVIVRYYTSRLSPSPGELSISTRDSA